MTSDGAAGARLAHFVVTRRGMRDDYDSPWKLILEHYFPAFLEFFFPEIYEDVDWQRGYDSLEQELRQVTRRARSGRRITDKLVRLWKRSGEEGLVLIHAEIQGRRDKHFARRMHTYNSRACDLYGLPVASLAVLGDEHKKWRPDKHTYVIWRCRVEIEFPIVKLCDYNSRWAELEASRNPFAVVVMAHLRTRATRHDPGKRLQWKRRLVQGLYEQGWEHQQIVDLFRFLDWMLHLPEELEQRFWNELMEYEEEKRMPYVTSVERIGFKRGFQEGVEVGKHEWLKQGMERGEAAALERLLVRRYGALPDWVEKLLAGASLEQLTGWLDRFIDAERLEDVFAAP